MDVPQWGAVCAALYLRIPNIRAPPGCLKLHTASHPVLPDTLIGLIGRLGKCTLIPAKNGHVSALPFLLANPPSF